MEHPIIVWFRQDLRLSDHPALTEAAKNAAILPVYIHSPEEEGAWPAGGASRVYLHHSLSALKKVLPSLIIRKGKAEDVLLQLIKETKASGVYWGRRYEKAVIERDTRLKSCLQSFGIEVRSFNHSLLLEPWDVKPYLVFTPYYRKVKDLLPEIIPLPVPEMKIYSKSLSSLTVDDLSLLPIVSWDKKIMKYWKAGENEALEHLQKFIKSHLESYHHDRDFPFLDEGTSRLSTALHFGEISPRTVWQKASAHQYAEPYLRQLIWRDFAHHLLYHHPETDLHPLKKEFSRFPWRDDPSSLQAWKEGRTGFPIVDAGMRQLWETGYMHNRLRMIVASFLVKDLLIPWQEGARYFWDTLVDADLANNTFGWQWAAGCGADAAPYFRIFNPYLQSQKFDPDGLFIKKWVPELTKVPAPYIHQPLQSASLITSCLNYPDPLVDHAQAKQEALKAFHQLKL